VLQAIYQKWKQKEEQGWFERINRVECQYGGTLILSIAVILQVGSNKEVDMVSKWMEEDFVDWDNLEEAWGWFRGKVIWGRIKVTRLCKVFYVLTKMVDADYS